ncbi:MAG TPA: DUF202 domain-containing protein [Mycobacteriales bacterium]|nr:DUF202 domain-containing protein [Mycobacteriales bacterium]
MTHVHEQGRANERTELAWQRTAVSLVVAAALLGRLTFDRLGVGAVVGVGAAVLLALPVLVVGRRRYARDAGLRPRTRPRDGRAPAALALTTVLLGATELAALQAR